MFNEVPTNFDNELKHTSTVIYIKQISREEINVLTETVEQHVEPLAIGNWSERVEESRARRVTRIDQQIANSWLQSVIEHQHERRPISVCKRIERDVVVVRE